MQRESCFLPRLTGRPKVAPLWRRVPGCANMKLLQLVSDSHAASRRQMRDDWTGGRQGDDAHGHDEDAAEMVLQDPSPPRAAGPGRRIPAEDKTSFR